MKKNGPEEGGIKKEEQSMFAGELPYEEQETEAAILPGSQKI